MMSTILELLDYLDSLGVVFGETKDEDLLLTAFTHKSFSADTPEDRISHNERLEFLGDAILGATVAANLFKLFPEAAESQLTLSKIYLVKESTLAQIARKINLGSYVRLGKGEEKSGGREKDAVLSDALEAVIGYIYLDCGRQSIESFIETYIMSQLDELKEAPGKSRKSKFQEYIQKIHKETPDYQDYEVEVEATGNVLVFGSKVHVLGEFIAEGQGPSKKKAQEQAAELAYRKMNE